MMLQQFSMETIPTPEGYGGRQLFFIFYLHGFAGIFRITYEDIARKNSSHQILRSGEVYFQGVKQTEMITTDIVNVTDACMFIERKKQWILERLKDGKKYQSK
jgi:hypothetical protein